MLTAHPVHMKNWKTPSTMFDENVITQFAHPLRSHLLNRVLKEVASHF